MAYALNWDAAGERLYETGTDHGVLYPYNSQPQQETNYYNGVAWNGLTAVTQSPSGAESNAIYADNMKYLDLRSAEEFAATVEAYTYPDEFAVCDGSAMFENAPGVVVSQQARKKFGMSYRSRIGNDEDGDTHGYKIHLIYGATASPSEKGYQTVNDSPEAISFSWELATEPVQVNGYPDLRPVAHLEIDSTKADATKLAALEQILYGTPAGDGTDAVAPRMPLPGEVISLMSTTTTPNEDQNADPNEDPNAEG